MRNLPSFAITVIHCCICNIPRHGITIHFIDTSQFEDADNRVRRPHWHLATSQIRRNPSTTASFNFWRSQYKGCAVECTVASSSHVYTTASAGFVSCKQFLKSLTRLTPVRAIMDAATMKAVVHYGYYPLNMSRLILIFNIIYAFSPILNQKDDLSDIPLTPSQRALLGLEPNSRPATPGSQYITPPRYGRSSTPGSGSRSKSVSPFSGKNSLGAIGTGISYSPSASPLFQKTFSRDVTRRLSYSTPSPLGLNRAANESSSSLIAPAPSPTIGKGASVGLNSRWLYEKGRSGSGMRSIYT